FIGSTAVLYKSTDGGKTSVNIAGNLPGTPINAIVLDPGNPNAIYVATDVGVFAVGDRGAAGANERWVRIGDNLPAAGVLSLSLTGASGTPTLIAGTHGRGAWSIPAIAPPSFTMSVSPSTQTIEAGQTATFTVTTAAVGGASTVSLSCGVGCAATPAQVPARQTATISVATTADAFESSEPFTLSADNQFTMVSVPLTVNVLTFSLSFEEPGGQNLLTVNDALEAGQSVTRSLAVQLIPTGGIAAIPYDAPISLSCPNAPPGVTCTFTPASIASLTQTVGGTVQIQTSASATPGSLALDVRAIGGSITRDLTDNLMINQFTIAVSPAKQAALAGTAAAFTVSA